MRRWRWPEIAIGLPIASFVTLVAFRGWPPLPENFWSTLGTWAGAAGSASAAWAAYKAATVPHALRRHEERTQGATDIEATEARIALAIKALKQIKPRIEQRHENWMAAKSDAVQFWADFAEPQRLLDPDEIPKKEESGAYDRLYAGKVQLANQAQEAFTSLTREELGQCLSALDVIRESSVRLFDVRMAIALAQAKADIAMAIEQARHPAYWQVMHGYINTAIGELDVYGRGIPAAKNLLRSPNP